MACVSLDLMLCHPALKAVFSICHHALPCNQRRAVRQREPVRLWHAVVSLDMAGNLQEHILKVFPALLLAPSLHS